MATLKHDMRHFSMANVSDNDTRRSYARSIDKFCSWLEDKEGKRLKMKDLKGKKLETVNAYSKYLQEQGYSSHTIHTYLAPICKAFQLRMDQVDKPTRRSIDITRGRMDRANLQGKREAQQDKYARTVAFEKAVGIRRAELRAVRLRDLQTDENGHFCVLVEKGKGGKRQLQRILPDCQQDVKDIFDAASASGADPDTRLFTDKELRNHIDYHGMRAALARKAYRYYLQKIENGEKETLKKELVDRWNACHEKHCAIVLYPSGKYGPVDSKAGGAKTAHFCRELNKETNYCLRGDNLVKARKEGAAGKYDRIALLCVSVFHLSHWRNDVTTSHYML